MKKGSQYEKRGQAERLKWRDRLLGKYERRIERLKTLLLFAQPYTIGGLRQEIDKELAKHDGQEP